MLGRLALIVAGIVVGIAIVAGQGFWQARPRGGAPASSPSAPSPASVPSGAYPAPGTRA